MKLADYIKSTPVISVNTIKKFLGCNSKYASLAINRLRKRKLLKKITRNKYTTLDNIYVIATNIYNPSYLSFWSASQYFGITEQIVNTIQIASTSRRKNIFFEDYNIKFIHTPKNYFFGFNKIQTEKGAIFVVEKEKLILDALLNMNEMGNFDEIIRLIINVEIDKEKLIRYIKRINNLTLIKRLGFLLEKYKKLDISQHFKIKDNNYINLDPLNKKAKKIISKWRIRI